MKCPYCQKEMQNGYIYNGNQPVQWIPDGKKPSILSFSATEDGVKLKNKFSLLKMGGYAATAFYCSSCQIVIAHTD